jgi:hypothetical protein
MIQSLPPLLCSHCTACEVPRLGPGAGQHVARLDCAACGRFLKWAPKVLVGPSLTERKIGMHASVNHCILLGTIGERGVEVRYAPSGSPCASFTLVITEYGSDGKTHQLWQPVEIWGKKAETVGELDAGALVLVDGKLRRTKKGEAWETVIASWDATPVQVPMPALSHREEALT